MASAVRARCGDHASGAGDVQSSHPMPSVPGTPQYWYFHALQISPVIFPLFRDGREGGSGNLDHASVSARPTPFRQLRDVQRLLAYLPTADSSADVPAPYVRDKGIPIPPCILCNLDPPAPAP